MSKYLPISNGDKHVTLCIRKLERQIVNKSDLGLLHLSGFKIEKV